MSCEEFTQSLIARLRRIAFLLDRGGDQILQSAGKLNYSQFLILMFLDKHGKLNQQQVASCTDLTPAAISKTIQHLLESGWVQSTVNSQNRREHLLNLTDIGRQELNNAYQLLNEHSKPIMQELTASEIVAMDSITGKILKFFSKHNQAE